MSKSYLLDLFAENRRSLLEGALSLAVVALVALGLVYAFSGDAAGEACTASLPPGLVDMPAAAPEREWSWPIVDQRDDEDQPRPHRRGRRS
jgi:hypothetical protein